MLLRGMRKKMTKTLENYTGKGFEFQVFPNSVKIFDNGKFCGGRIMTLEEFKNENQKSAN